MRKIISKSTAIRYVVLIFALIGIMAIWPCRIFTGLLETSGGGTIVDGPQLVNFEYGNYMQEFIAQYDRLSSVDVFVEYMSGGRYISCILYDENGAIIFKTYV